MKSNIIKRTLYKKSGLVLEFLIFLPKVYVNTNDKANVFNIELNPILMLKKDPIKYGIYDPSLVYKIHPANLYKVRNMLSEAIGWFTDKKMEDLYLVDDDNILLFNTKYSELSIHIINSFTDNHTMKIFPDVISYNDGKAYEGVRLCINKTENVVSLPLEILHELYSIICDFNFSNESYNAINFVKMAIESKDMLTTKSKWYEEYE